MSSVNDSIGDLLAALVVSHTNMRVKQMETELQSVHSRHLALGNLEFLFSSFLQETNNFFLGLARLVALRLSYPDVKAMEVYPVIRN